jgi:hypothetical protein
MTCKTEAKPLIKTPYAELRLRQNRFRNSFRIRAYQRRSMQRASSVPMSAGTRGVEVQEKNMKSRCPPLFSLNVAPDSPGAGRQGQVGGVKT